ncbi:MAG TPA: winged helix-turn-helix domain-containing protein [Burkholderiales bacterium]|nr:winged helix-turn-helix domain-containing protein [Burkholderiales bacterium]
MNTSALIAQPRLGRIAALVADPARSRMLSLLLSGEVATAGELARAACVTPATASSHLAKMEEGGLITCQARGRHRFYRLTDEHVAHALEALAVVAEGSARDAQWDRPDRQQLRDTRTCYHHLAGRLGVALFDTLLHTHCLEPAGDGYMLNDRGRQWFVQLGLSPRPSTSKRRYAYPCLDWSERRHHLAGQLADEALSFFLDRGWLRRGQGRIIRVTPAGQQQFLPRLDSRARAIA